MTGGHDAFDALRSANPLPEGTRLEPLLVAAKEVLDRAIAEPPPPRRWPRRAAVTVVAGMALATAGWTAVSLLDQADRTVTVGCYAAAHPRGQVEVVAHDGRSPVELCAELWQHGAFGPDPAPALQPCVLPSGTVAVVPGKQPETCAALGASPLEPPAPGGEADVMALREALVAAVMSEGCIEVPRAVELVERALAQGRFIGWTVQVTGGSGPDRPCATLGFDVPSERVLVVPGPRPPSGGLVRGRLRGAGQPLPDGLDLFA